MEKGKFYLFEIRGWKEPIYGIVEIIGTEWILIKNIINDYTFDGYSLIQHRNIKNHIRSEDELFTEQVLKAKGILDIMGPNIPLNTKLEPFKWLEEQNITILLSPKDESICYVGKIKKNMKTFFQFISMNTKGHWDTYIYKYKFPDIRLISINTDYVNSLLIYNEQLININISDCVE